MKTDAYTKAILTVIAVALVQIAFKGSPPIMSRAYANDSAIVEPTPVNIVAINGISLPTYENKNTPMIPVHICGIVPVVEQLK